MKILVINAGSSSLKYQLIDMSTETALCKGLVEKIGIEGSKLIHEFNGKNITEGYIADHTQALEMVLSALTDKKNPVIASVKDIVAVGHRVLHSGEDFNSSIIVDEEALKILHKNKVLGPLHMPANIACIESCMKVMQGVPMIAVFDTGFHSTMPDYAYMYAIDYDDYKNYKVRKYGFHGTSHKFVTAEAIKYLNMPKSKIITCHLGNGSSMACVLDGKCIDTTMGLTPLEGLIMGTRSGDIDAAAVQFLAEQKGMTIAQVTDYLNKQCGFKGLAGVSDCRDLNTLANDGNERAILAKKMFGYRIRKYIGSYIAALNGLDCLVFTGGIGENSSEMREEIMRGLDCFGIDFDFDHNSNFERGKIVEMNKVDSKVKVLIIPTNEELVIARDSKELITK